MRLFLIAGGPSVADYDLQALRGHGTMVGVNDAGVLVPGVTVIVTMDRLWTENRWDYIREKDAQFIVRKNVWNRFAFKIEADIIQPPEGLRVEAVEMDHTQSSLCLDSGYLHGRNSGFCAFNWAVQKRPKEIYVFGYDMSHPGEQRHWHDPYPWSLKPKNHYGHWAADFDEAKPVCDKLGIQVFNCSPTSRIEAFPRLKTMKAVMEKLK